ncbi:MAG: TerB family tellurite resistance protein [Paludibacter sp.]|nr:TerB family tellurite resistance protein [Paludibacter sp.]
METITFDRLLLKTAFCCMASDGNIDKREIALIKTMCENSPIFKEFDFKEEINSLVKRLNDNGKDFINYYFGLLKDADLNVEDELILIDFAVKTIKSDELIQYSEIKFFKAIRHNLKLSDEQILAKHDDIEYWLEDDIKTESNIDKLINQYLEVANLPQFELISYNDIELLQN